MKIKINESSLTYEINSNKVIDITNINFQTKEGLEKLINRLLIKTNYYGFDYFNKTNIDLKDFHFVNHKLTKDCYRIKSFVSIGRGIKGELNNICDVEGVRVGHKTIHNGPYNTGVTVIQPHPGNLFKEKVVGASLSFNGFGKSIGFVQVDELGTIESNIVFTTTLNVGKIANGVVEEALEQNPEIGETTGTVNPLVMECNDGSLNKSRDRILEKEDYKEALKDLKKDFLQGDVGAGSGMKCHGFKGGIGSSSRIVTIDGKTYTVGIIVNSNFGTNNGKDLILDGIKYNQLKEIEEESDDEKGSIAVCFATDAPLNERQIRRCLKRAELGIGRTGSFAGNGSGDVFVGFSTANKRYHFNNTATHEVTFFDDDSINSIFRATVDATEEAVLNSLFFAHHLKGYKEELDCLSEALEKKQVEDLYQEEIVWLK